MRTLFEPKGRAKEYVDLALNLYSGCSHGCKYCCVPLALKEDREKFHELVSPIENLLEATKERLSQGDIKGREIFLSLYSDPFPYGVDNTITYDIIQAIKDSGNHVNILTKGRIDTERLFALLDSNDKFGVTLSCGNELSKLYEPKAATVDARLSYLKVAKASKLPTYVSCEPVLQPEFIYYLITQMKDAIDMYRIGRLTHFRMKREINWSDFGDLCIELCKRLGKQYTLTYELRESMKYL